MDYKVFERTVQEIVGAEEFSRSARVLDAVGEEARARYIASLKCDFGMSASYAIVVMGRNLPDENFYRFLSYAAGELKERLDVRSDM